jgi:hypothetical protein
MYVAATMLTNLGILNLETIFLFLYVKKNRTILPEEPVGLLGAANLLQNSNIPNIIGNIHQKPGFDGFLHRETDQPTAERETQRSWLSTLICCSTKPKKTSTDEYLLDTDCFVIRSKTYPFLQIIVDGADDSAPGRCPATKHSHISECENPTPGTGEHQPTTVAVEPHTPVTTIDPAIPHGQSSVLSKSTTHHKIPRKRIGE